MNQKKVKKTVNLYASTYYIVEGISVTGFTNKVELDVSEIRLLLIKGVIVTEVINGKTINLTLTNYDKDYNIQEPVNINKPRKNKHKFK